MMAPTYRAKFSHRFDAGPSGPARQYWDIETEGGRRVLRVCLTDTETAESEAASICHAMYEARLGGAADLRRAFQALMT